MGRLLFPFLLLMVSSVSAIREIQDTKQNKKMAVAPSSYSRPVDPSQVVKLSQNTRAFIYKGFASNKECGHLISLAHQKHERSMVESQGESDKSSSGMFLQSDQDDVVSGIEDKIAVWTLLPKENGGPLQILHYNVNEKYQPHSDYIKDEYIASTKGQRLATVLIYLSTVTQGGETYFQEHEEEDLRTNNNSGTLCRTSSHLVKAVKGDALLLFTLHPNMTEDKRSAYGSCPVLEGEKWFATKYIHTKPYSENQISLRLAADGCTDEEENCPVWAAHGECERNPVYMIGSPDYQGTCRKSCQVCNSSF